MIPFLMRVESAINEAVCQKDLLDGSHATLFARAMIVPNAPFRKLVAVHNLRLLLKDHLPREKFKHVKEAGSTLYKLDVDGSDHDIEVCPRVMAYVNPWFLPSLIENLWLFMQ